MTTGDNLRAHAAAQGIPLRTRDDVQAALEIAKRTKADVSMARLMLRHGRITDEARAWLVANYGEAK